MLTFPRELLPLDPASVEQLLGTPLPRRTGIGRLVGSALNQVARDVDDYEPTEAAGVASIVLELLTELVTHALAGRVVTELKPHQHILLTRVQAFILERLGDPGLSPEIIAAAHHISTRSLHRLFQAGGSGVAEWVRSQRIDACRRDLSNPRMRHHVVHAIAARWGFVDAAHSSRVFRAATGVVPREYRRRNLALQDENDGADRQL